ncbi:MAG: hypothetical protein AABW89_01720 [Nanoarchaeota archaeon]
MSEETIDEQAQRPYKSKLLKMVPTAVGITMGTGLASLTLTAPEIVPYVTPGAVVGTVLGAVVNSNTLERVRRVRIYSTDATKEDVAGVFIATFLGGIGGVVTGISASFVSTSAFTGPLASLVGLTTGAVFAGATAGVSVGSKDEVSYRNRTTEYLGAALLTYSAMLAGSYLKPDTEIEAVRQFQTENDRGVVITLGREEIPYIEREGLFIKFDNERNENLKEIERQSGETQNKERENWNKRREEIMKPTEKK